MKIKVIIISIILLLVIVFASGCIPVLEKLGLVSPANEEQLSPEKGGPPDGLVKVLIGFKEKPGASQQAMVRGVGGKIKYTYHIVDAIAASIPEKAIVALQKNPNVRYVEPDVEIFAIGQPLPWGVDRIDAEVVWTDYTGLGVNVAIIDSGIDRTHPDLNCTEGENFVSIPSWKNPDPDKWDDDYGHGTHVAGIVAALDNEIGVVGVAPRATLYALKVLGKTGRGNYSDVIAALQWCMENGSIQVTNNSYGSSGDPGPAVEDAFYISVEAGILHVAAAGNSGGAVIYPAAYESVIAVSATDSSDILAGFSSRGEEVELAAPGVDIYSTYKDGDYATYSGTSMAAPHVAGVAALVWAKNLTDSNEDIRTWLQNTADDLGVAGWDSKYGWGLVDAENAVLETTVGNNLPLLATGSISGIVTDDELDPITGATVTANGKSTTTSTDGLYIISDLSVSSYTVTASATGYNEDSQSADVSEGGTTVVDFTLTPETTPSKTMHVSNIDMSLKKAGINVNAIAIVTIFAVDTDGNPLSPVEGATVSGAWSGATRDSDSGVTDVNGKVSLLSDKVKIPKGETATFTFTVNDVIKDGYTSLIDVGESNYITFP